MLINVIFRNKETQEEETAELTIEAEDITCLYRDQYGTYVSIVGGKNYKVTQKLEELEKYL